MNKQDLELIPMDELIEEIFNRTSDCCIVYGREVGDELPLLTYFIKDGDLIVKLGMLEYLKCKCIEQFKQEIEEERDVE